MRNILDLIDHVLAEECPSDDAMRWAPDHTDPTLDLRPIPYRRTAAHLQATWGWWCSTCQQPMPQPRWNRPPVHPGAFAYHEATDGYAHRIERKETTR